MTTDTKIILAIIGGILVLKYARGVVGGVSQAVNTAGNTASNVLNFPSSLGGAAAQAGGDISASILDAAKKELGYAYDWVSNSWDSFFGGADAPIDDGEPVDIVNKNAPFDIYKSYGWDLGQGLEATTP